MTSAVKYIMLAGINQHARRKYSMILLQNSVSFKTYELSYLCGPRRPVD